MMHNAPLIHVQTAPFAPQPPQGFGDNAGALISFTGIVRPDDGLEALEIEHYPGMTQALLHDYATNAMRRFRLIDCLVIHRYGRLSVGEAIMMVAVAAAHRRAAFDGADYLMDFLKTRAPFWKREIGPEGPRGWVEAKEQDEKARMRWEKLHSSPGSRI